MPVREIYFKFPTIYKRVKHIETFFIIHEASSEISIKEISATIRKVHFKIKIILF
jgi:hypothetical protein